KATPSEIYFLGDFPVLYYMIQYLNATYAIQLHPVYGHYNKTTGEYYGIIKALYLGIGDVA
ncbi:Ionotropic receptor 75e, partial [Diabrotica virgifera virgifera]